MPLQWRISRLEHVVLSVAEGTVTRADIEGYLDALEEKGALPYQKIFVAQSGTLDLSASDLSWLSERLAALNDRGPLGPFAVVAAPDRNADFMRFFTALAGVKRRLRLFRTIHDARRWLDRQRGRPSAGEGIAVRALPLR
jgi:hypothetical protein